MGCHRRTDASIALLPGRGVPVPPFPPGPLPRAADPAPTAREAAGSPRQRVGDADRDEVHALLAQAHALGHLDRVELEERVGRALGAVTAGDLAEITADLPVAELRRHDPVARAARERASRRGVRAHVGAYLAGMAVMVTVWLVVGLTAGAWYPWPIWPALGWGIGVLGHVVPVRRHSGPGQLPGLHRLAVGAAAPSTPGARRR